MIPKKFAFIAVLTLTALLGTGCLSLSQDITPPPDPTEEGMDREPTPSLKEPTAPPPTAVDEGEDPGTTEAQSETPEQETLGSVVVSLDNQGAEGLEGSEVTVRLEGFDHMTQVYSDSVRIQAGDSAQFQEVPFRPGRFFFASVPYQGAVYRSDVAEVEAEVDELALSVEVYGTTTDPAGLSIDRAHIFVDFLAPDRIQMGEMYVMSNVGERTVVAPEPGVPVVSFPLPAEAANISFQNGALGERFIPTEEGFGDTASIPPGSGVYQVMVSYELPYPQQKLSFDQVMPYPVGSVIIMTPVGDVKLRGQGIESMGERQVQNGSIQVYARQGMEAGDHLIFTISGQPGGGQDLGQTADPPPGRNLWIGLASLGLILALTGLYLYRRLRRESEAAEAGTAAVTDADRRQELMDAIIDLDDRFQAGELGREDYQARRTALKAELRGIINEDEDRS